MLFNTIFQIFQHHIIHKLEVGLLVYEEPVLQNKNISKQAQRSSVSRTQRIYYSVFDFFR